jgi:tetratricopeptide (TPR) repeat protein
MGENDFEWYNLGQDSITTKDYQNALAYFEKLCLSQPQSFEGYLGVAHVSNFQNNQEKAIWFIEQALKLAKESYDEGYTDVIILEEIQNDHEDFKLGN